MLGSAEDAERTAIYKPHEHKHGGLKRRIRRLRVPQWREDQHLPTCLHALLSREPEDHPGSCHCGEAEGGEAVSGRNLCILWSLGCEWTWSLESASSLGWPTTVWCAWEEDGRKLPPTLPLNICKRTSPGLQFRRQKPWGYGGGYQVSHTWRGGRGVDLCLQNETQLPLSDGEVEWRGITS